MKNMNMEKVQSYKAKLKSLHQDQIMKYYDELNTDEQNKLLSEINFDEISLINHNYDYLITHSKEYDEKVLNQKYHLSPAKIYYKNNFKKINKFSSIGDKVIQAGELAVVLLAGGLGTRLGYNGPKGTFSLNINGHKLTLFESFINQAHQAHNKYGVYLPIYIMCSKNNYDDTISYFNDNNYFNYPKYSIHFFIQTELPLCDKEGHIILENKYTIARGPDGNGDVFKCLYNKYFQELIKDNTKWLVFTGIDNILIDLIDPLIIGLTIKNNLSVASKSITKETANERGYVFGRQNNLFYMLENGKQNTYIKNKKDIWGRYLYRETNITYHLVSTSLLPKLAQMDLPFHSALRKEAYLDSTGQKVIPDVSNSYKFEHYIYEAFYQEKNMLVLSVDKKEFSPLKNKEGDKSIETVEEDYLKYSLQRNVK